jgi:hypothetical protein
VPRGRVFPSLYQWRLSTASAAAVEHFHVAVSASVHHVMPAAAETTKMVVMMPSAAETKDDARAIAVISVAAMTATVPIAAVAMAIASPMHIGRDVMHHVSRVSNCVEGGAGQLSVQPGGLSVGCDHSVLGRRQ